MTVDKDSTLFAIDTKRMFHLGYRFAEEDVEWYKMVEDLDDPLEEPVDDWFVTTGFSLPLVKMALSSGYYYARINLPEQTALMPCEPVLLSDVLRYVSYASNDFLLVPNYVKTGEIVTLIGLKETDVAKIRIYNASGAKLLDTEVSGVTSFDYMPDGSAGVYLLRVQTQDRKKTLKFIVNK